jgi:hypothetical protein
MSNNFESNYKNWHQKISYLKSFTRILAALICGLMLSFASTDVQDTILHAVLILASGILVAEILGIIEEWV